MRVAWDVQHKQMKVRGGKDAKQKEGNDNDNSREEKY
jgi:hypothetical protein